MEALWLFGHFRSPKSTIELAPFLSFGRMLETGRRYIANRWQWDAKHHIDAPWKALRFENTSTSVHHQTLPACSHAMFVVGSKRSNICAIGDEFAAPRNWKRAAR